MRKPTLLICPSLGQNRLAIVLRLETDPRPNGGPDGGGTTDRGLVPPPAIVGRSPADHSAEDPSLSRRTRRRCRPGWRWRPTAPAHHAAGRGDEVVLARARLTRIEELDDYLDQLVADKDILPRAARRARIISRPARPPPRTRRATGWGQRLANSVHVERVMSHIDAAEAFILRAAPLEHVAAQVPAILNHVRNHLAKDNVQREQAEAIGTAMREQGPS